VSDALKGRIGKSRQNRYSVKLVTKENIANGSRIGGMPSWRHKPAWPKDQLTDKGMVFFGQIQLDDYIFPKRKAEFAYIFIGAKSNPHLLSENNAVVFQSKESTSAGDLFVSQADWDGQVLRPWDDPKRESLELYFELEKGTDDPGKLQGEWSNAYWDAMSEVQIGGLPFFDPIDLEDAESVLGNVLDWRLLLFINCDDQFPLLVPPKSQSLYVFVNEECTEGRVVAVSRV
jgi:uncharacterized protein YwqG